ncbi:hypothetical protein M1446_05520 [Candidatus Dependentiae bacterium]|nr:hypothetical protein [Candidatus Dependentiae bacterium]
MTKTLIVLNLFTFPLFTGITESKISISNIEHITKKEFEVYKNRLPIYLKFFIDDFATWSKEDKDKIEIIGLDFKVNNLSDEKQQLYDGDLANWIMISNITLAQKICLTSCLQYLKQ